MWGIAIGVSGFGNFIVRKTILRLREKHKIYKSFEDDAKDNEKDDYNRSSGLLGVLELIVYFSSVVLGFSQFIGWWLVVKIAGRWNQGGPPQEIDPIDKWDSISVKKEKRRRAAAALNIFLIGNLLNIIFGVGGGLIAKYSYDILVFIKSMHN